MDTLNATTIPITPSSLEPNVKNTSHHTRVQSAFVGNGTRSSISHLGRASKRYQRNNIPSLSIEN